MTATREKKINDDNNAKNVENNEGSDEDHVGDD